MFQTSQRIHARIPLAWRQALNFSPNRRHSQLDWVADHASDFHVILQAPEGGASEPAGPKAVETENWKKPGASERHLFTSMYIIAFWFHCFDVVGFKSAFDRHNLVLGTFILESEIRMKINMQHSLIISMMLCDCHYTLSTFSGKFA